MTKNIVVGVGVLVALVFIVAYVINTNSGDGAPNTGASSVSFESREHGVSFTYPDTYFVHEQENGTGEREQHALVLAEDTPENRRVFAGLEPGREGPPTISVTIYQNNLDSYSVSEWVNGTNFSNVKLATTPVTQTTLAGESALRYSATGLYENDNVVVAHDNHVYMFTVSYLTPTDTIRSDFTELLKTVRFNDVSEEL